MTALRRRSALIPMPRKASILAGIGSRQEEYMLQGMAILLLLEVQRTRRCLRQRSSRRYKLDGW
jgi:hypothetical protein